MYVISSLERRGAEIFLAELAGELEHLGVVQSLVSLAAAGPLPIELPDKVSVATPDSSRGRIRTIRKMLKTQRPELVVCLGSKALKYFVVSSVGSSIEVIYCKIGLTEPWLKRFKRLRIQVDRWFIGRACKVVSLGDNSTRELTGVFSVSMENVVHIRNGRRVTPSLHAERADGLLHLACIGALNWEKNVGLVIELMHDLAPQFPQLRLDIVGDGPQRQELENRVVTLQIGDKVNFLGASDDIPGVLAGTDLLVLASLSEGVPGVLIEAGMASVPVVTWQVGDVDEVVLDGKTGTIVPFAAHADLKRALIVLLNDAHKRAVYGEAARQYCVETFGMDTIALEYFNLFHAVTNNVQS
ncbi:glycosyltransferase [Candidatus Litorirhabdus singularis]|nr:glycosyltransferase [Candidatus Litorirhabdus singularis]